MSKEPESVNIHERGAELQKTFSRCFDSEAGEVVLKQLERICDARSTRYGIPIPPGTQICPYEAIHREGMRAVYFYITGIIEAGKAAANAT